MARNKINSRGQKVKSIYPKNIVKLTQQHCSDLVTQKEVQQIIELFLEGLKKKFLNLESVFISNFGVFSPKLLAPKKSLQHWVTKERRPISACATVRFRFDPEIINLIKTMEKTKHDQDDE
jgi:nucleoid DNA-binding protein